MKIVALMLHACMTKNGSETLQAVLKRINKLTPDEVVNRCLILDDYSTDDPRKIEKSFGWQVGLNEGTGAHAEKTGELTFETMLSAAEKVKEACSVALS